MISIYTMRQLRSIIILTMLTALVKLFGCSGQTKKSGLSKEMKEQLAQSVDAFKNRSIHATLTAQIIDTTSDDNLLQVVFDNLSAKLSSNPENENETVMTWNKSRQAIYMIWLLEAEVNNGGCNQFYFNSSGQFYKHLPEALKLVGALKFSALTEQANSTYEKENEKITKHRDETLEGFSKSDEDNPLNEYDDKFYELYQEENLQKIQVEYIRKHKDEFVDK